MHSVTSVPSSSQRGRWGAPDAYSAAKNGGSCRVLSSARRQIKHFKRVHTHRQGAGMNARSHRRAPRVPTRRRGAEQEGRGTLTLHPVARDKRKTSARRQGLAWPSCYAPTRGGIRNGRVGRLVRQAGSRLADKRVSQPRLGAHHRARIAWGRTHKRGLRRTIKPPLL